MLDKFGTEMVILNKTTIDDLSTVVGEKLAKIIDDARQGKLHIHSGGGGVYGKVEVKP